MVYMPEDKMYVGVNAGFCVNRANAYRVKGDSFPVPIGREMCEVAK